MNRQLTAEQISAEKFAEFGELIENKTNQRRKDFFLQFANANAPQLWVNRLFQTSEFPIYIDVMERHPYSAQTFIPMQAGRCLTVVTHTDINGQPDVNQLRAFRT